MLWNKEETYKFIPHKKESELEAAVQTVKEQLFGKDRIYLVQSIKRKMAQRVKPSIEQYQDTKKYILYFKKR